MTTSTTLAPPSVPWMQRSDTRNQRECTSKGVLFFRRSPRKSINFSISAMGTDPAARPSWLYLTLLSERALRMSASSSVRRVWSRLQLLAAKTLRSGLVHRAAPCRSPAHRDSILLHNSLMVTDGSVTGYIGKNVAG